jgi:hypothetical protein
MEIVFYILEIFCFIGMVMLTFEMSKHMLFRESWILWVFTFGCFGYLLYNVITFDPTLPYYRSKSDSNVGHNKS